MSWTRFRYHIILGTKNRKPLITPEVELVLYPLIKDLVYEFGGHPIELNGVWDHAHLACAIPPKIAVASFIGQLKSKSSKRLNRLMKLPGPFKWQSEYGALTANPHNIEPLRRYIRHQKHHHANRTTLPRWENPHPLPTSPPGRPRGM